MSDQPIPALHLRAQLQMLDASDVRQLWELKAADEAASAASPARQQLEREQALLSGKLLQTQREQATLRQQMAARLERIKQQTSARNAAAAAIATWESEGAPR